MIHDFSAVVPTCSEECKQELRRRTNIERYGVENVFQSEEIKSRIVATNNRKYGVDHPHQSEEIRAKRIATMKEKYGVEHALQSEEIKQKWKETNLEKYGTEYSVTSEKVRSKIAATVAANGGYTLQRPDCVKKFTQTNEERYGDAVPTRTESVKAKTAETNLQRYGSTSALSKGTSVRDRVEQTNRIRYGGVSPFSSKEVQDRSHATVASKYGVSNVFQSEQVKQTIKESMIAAYGVDNPMKSEVLKQKAARTVEERYGHKSWRGSDVGLRASLTDPSKLELFKQFRDSTEEFLKSQYEEPPTLQKVASDIGVDIATVSRYIVEQNLQRLVVSSKSYMEEEICDILQSIDPTVLLSKRNRSIITPKELDIYLPEYSLAIECNPTYTHNSSFPTAWLSNVLPYDYHKKKTELCEAKGIRLFHIFGYQWTNKREIVVSMLRNLLKKNSRMVYARSTVVRNVSGAESMRFLDENHIQGRTQSAVRLGLYAGEELISLMTFSKPRHGSGYSKKYDDDTWELTRFCTKLNTTCVGGASKLFKHFLKEHSPSQVVSFSDRSITSGNLYEVLGFQNVGYVSPGYVWVRLQDDSYYSRVACQKQNLPKLLYEPDLDTVNQTEAQIMESHGYARVYNSGLVKWQFCN